MRILIVDDDYIAREHMTDHLKAYGSIDRAPTGEIAILLFQEAHKRYMPYELISMDIEMPTMNGPQVVEKLRAYERSLKISGAKEVKIMMATSRDEMSMVAESYAGGCSAYITKPATEEKIKKAFVELGFKA
ncbi:MAG: response regulator [Candidatus Omnitrophica bacterium]|nr:response regulator [Candidatus Omnitrophota bacterium]